LTRSMRSSKQSVSPYWMILVAQVGTLVLIGLWHGVTIGFALWGLWHGLGLFIQNRWSDHMKGRTPAWGKTLIGERVLRIAGVFLTFNYVSLGWLFFTLSTPTKVWSTLAILFGVS
jgi:alginate O-acetyltransferase complex protein AlgI